MNIQFSGQHIEVSEALRDRFKKRLKKIEKHFGKILDIHINIRVEKRQHSAEATVQVRGNTLFATATCDDMYSAFDKLGDKLDRQVIKHKEKLKSHHNKDIDHHIPKK